MLNNKLEEKLTHYFHLIIKLIEHLLAVIILLTLMVVITKNIVNVDRAYFESIDGINVIISDVLLILVALELVRLLIVPSIRAVLELMIFVAARKMLIPRITSLDLLLDVIALSILMIINYACFINNKQKDEL